MIKSEKRYFNQFNNLLKTFKKNSEKVYDKKCSLKSYKKFFEYKWLDRKEAIKIFTVNQLEIFDNYHSIQSYEKYNKLITVDLNDISDAIIIFIQNKILALLKEKEMAIESMITSNTRISFYNNFKEHHILQWLQNPNSPDIVLASDDPGIFNNNLYLEYFILYNILEDTDFDRKSIINRLITNSEKYSFQ